MAELWEYINCSDNNSDQPVNINNVDVVVVLEFCIRVICLHQFHEYNKAEFIVYLIKFFGIVSLEMLVH